MTNEEKIKSLNDAELAEFLYNAGTEYCQYTCKTGDGHIKFTGRDCIKCIECWLSADCDLPYKKTQ